jgi:hypothetical protein
MTRGEPALARLTGLTALILEARLAALRRAAEARAESEALLAALNLPEAADAGLQGAAQPLAALAYQRWADARRAEINRRIARQTAEWLEAADSARSAFGRNLALERLARSRPPRS